MVKKEWLDLILSGRKTWEIRGMATSKRGWIHFAERQAGGKLMGRARLVDCIPLSGTTEAGFKKDFKRHRLPSLKVVPYKKPYAWVFKDAERFAKPYTYEHRQGAVIWVEC